MFRFRKIRENVIGNPSQQGEAGNALFRAVLRVDTRVLFAGTVANWMIDATSVSDSCFVYRCVHVSQSDADDDAENAPDSRRHPDRGRPVRMEKLHDLRDATKMERFGTQPTEVRFRTTAKVSIVHSEHRTIF